MAGTVMDWRRKNASGIRPVEAQNNGTSYRGTASDTDLMDTPRVPNPLKLKETATRMHTTLTYSGGMNKNNTQ